MELGKLNFSVLVLSLSIVICLAATAGASAGASSGTDFQHTEFAVFGSSNSSSWRSLVQGKTPFSVQEGDKEDSGFDEFGGGIKEADAKSEAGQDGVSNMSRRVKTGFLSALMPGAGQYYNGYKKKAYIMAGIEVGIWTAYFVFDHQGDLRMESAREYAGYYAGTSGSHEDSYWQSVGRYMDSDAYDESRMREARALQEPAVEPTSGADAWQWVNSDRKSAYQLLRADGNTAYDHRDFMILFSVINRAISVIDGVMGVNSHPGGIDAEVLGMNVSVDMLPSWSDPGAKWAISRSF